jgi:hypothetical protein
MATQKERKAFCLEYKLKKLESVELSFQLVAGQKKVSPVATLKSLDRRLVQNFLCTE